LRGDCRRADGPSRSVQRPSCLACGEANNIPPHKPPQSPPRLAHATPAGPAHAARAGALPGRTCFDLGPGAARRRHLGGGCDLPLGRQRAAVQRHLTGAERGKGFLSAFAGRRRGSQAGPALLGGPRAGRAASSFQPASWSRPGRAPLAAHLKSRRLCQVGPRVDRPQAQVAQHAAGAALRGRSGTGGRGRTFWRSPVWGRRQAGQARPSPGLWGLWAASLPEGIQAAAPRSEDRPAPPRGPLWVPRRDAPAAAQGRRTRAPPAGPGPGRRSARRGPAKTRRPRRRRPWHACRVAGCNERKGRGHRAKNGAGPI
jgi:hypothetical protein